MTMWETIIDNINTLLNVDYGETLVITLITVASIIIIGLTLYGIHCAKSKAVKAVENINVKSHKKDIIKLRSDVDDLEYTTYYDFNKEFDNFIDNNHKIRDRKKLELISKKLQD